MRLNAVIVAAGEGKRMGGSVAKSLRPLGGRPMILRTLAGFAASQVQKVIVVAAQKDQPEFERLFGSDPAAGKLEWILQTGGARRQDSVNEGLKRLDGDCDIVVVHDAARPLVSAQLIDRCIDAARKEGAAVAGLPIKDTIKVVSPSRRVESTPPRDSLWEIQTPQAFRTEMIREAHAHARLDPIEATDDATLVERLGKTVVVVEGERSNIKITTPEDLVFAEALLRDARGV